MASRSKSKQFGNAKAGAREKGFTQWSEKAVTAAKQGKPMGNKATAARPKNNGSKQFTKAGGKAVF